ncbi:MAG: alpha-galactosidase, partial [Bacteroidota bacterium]
SEHLGHYEMMMMSNLGGGVQACYRGPRLFDTDETTEMVQSSVAWYKAHREVLEGDIIHLRRADGRDLDYWLNVNPGGVEKGLLMIFNPTDRPITKQIEVPLYYTGLTDAVDVERPDGTTRQMRLSRDYKIKVAAEVAPKGFSWMIFK